MEKHYRCRYQTGNCDLLIVDFPLKSFNQTKHPTCNADKENTGCQRIVIAKEESKKHYSDTTTNPTTKYRPSVCIDGMRLRTIWTSGILGTEATQFTHLQQKYYENRTEGSEQWQATSARGFQNKIVIDLCTTVLCINLLCFSKANSR